MRWASLSLLSSERGRESMMRNASIECTQHGFLCREAKPNLVAQSS
jgi:hypothetical protein